MSLRAFLDSWTIIIIHVPRALGLGSSRIPLYTTSSTALPIRTQSYGIIRSYGHSGSVSVFPMCYVFRGVYRMC